MRIELSAWRDRERVYDKTCGSIYEIHIALEEALMTQFDNIIIKRTWRTGKEIQIDL